MRPSHGLVQAREHLGRAEVLLELLYAACPGDDGRDTGVGGAPRDRELGQGTAQLVGDGCEGPDLGVRVGVGEPFPQPLVAGELSPRTGRDAFEVLPREQPGGERAPGRQAEPDVLVEPGELLLDALAVQEVVLRLLHDRLVEMVALGDLPGGPDLLGGPLRGAPVEGLARAHDVVHREHRLLDRRLGVGPVAEEQVDEVEPQALERAVDRLEEVLPVERAAGVDAVVDAPEELGRDDVAVSGPAELGDRPPHDPLGLPARVRLGVVEEVHPRLVGRLQAAGREVGVELRSEGDPGPEGQDADLQT